MDISSVYLAFHLSGNLKWSKGQLYKQRIYLLEGATLSLAKILTN